MDKDDLVYTAELIPEKIYEAELQRYIADKMKREGLNPYIGYPCSAGIADIVTDVSVIEVKTVLNRRKLFTACGQVLAYRSSIDPSLTPIIAGLYVPGLYDLYGAIEEQGVTIMTWSYSMYLTSRLERLLQENAPVTDAERRAIDKWREDFFDGEVIYKDQLEPLCINLLLQRITGSAEVVPSPIYETVTEDIGIEKPTRKEIGVLGVSSFDPRLALHAVALNGDVREVLYPEHLFKTSVDLFKHLSMKLGVTCNELLVGAAFYNSSSHLELIIFVTEEEFDWLLKTAPDLVEDDIYFCYEKLRARFEFFPGEQESLNNVLESYRFKHLVDEETVLQLSRMTCLK